MLAKAKLSVFVLALAALIVIPMNVDAKKARQMYRVSHVGRVITDKPIEIGVDNKGVKLETITFTGDEATIIVWNRTPHSVKAHIGLALYSKKNFLLAASSDSASFTRTFTQIRAGKQANFKIKFEKFMHSFDGVSKYALVFVTEI
ncbi:MAG: hypothetical protein ACE5LB_13830 [Acidiferrobacterales bacterium]